MRSNLYIRITAVGLAMSLAWPSGLSAEDQPGRQAGSGLSNISNRISQSSVLVTRNSLFGSQALAEPGQTGLHSLLPSGRKRVPNLCEMFAVLLDHEGFRQGRPMSTLQISQSTGIGSNVVSRLVNALWQLDLLYRTHEVAGAPTSAASFEFAHWILKSFPYGSVGTRLFEAIPTPPFAQTTINNPAILDAINPLQRRKRKVLGEEWRSPTEEIKEYLQRAAEGAIRPGLTIEALENVLKPSKHEMKLLLETVHEIADKTLEPQAAFRRMKEILLSKQKVGARPSQADAPPEGGGSADLLPLETHDKARAELDRLLKAANIPMYRYAEGKGVSQGLLSDYVHGRRRISPKNLLQVFDGTMRSSPKIREIRLELFRSARLRAQQAVQKLNGDEGRFIHRVQADPHHIAAFLKNDSEELNPGEFDALVAAATAILKANPRTAAAQSNSGTTPSLRMDIEGIERGDFNPALAAFDRQRDPVRYREESRMRFADKGIGNPVGGGLIQPWMDQLRDEAIPAFFDTSERPFHFLMALLYPWRGVPDVPDTEGIVAILKRLAAVWPRGNAGFLRGTFEFYAAQAALQSVDKITLLRAVRILSKMNSIPLDIDVALLLLGHLREFGFHGEIDFELLAGVINRIIRVRHETSGEEGRDLARAVPERFQREHFPPIFFDDLVHWVVRSATDKELWKDDMGKPIPGLYSSERQKSSFGTRVLYASQQVWRVARRSARVWDPVRLGLIDPRLLHFNGSMLLRATGADFDLTDEININQLISEECLSFVTGRFVDPLLRMLEPAADSFVARAA